MIIRGEADFQEEVTREFFLSQLIYALSDGDSFNEYRKKWDPMTKQGMTVSKLRYRELLKQDELEEVFLLWFAVRSPGMGVLNDRDLCLVKHLSKTVCPVTGEPVAVANFFSWTSPAVPDMETALGRIRAHVYLGGYVLRPRQDDKKHHTLSFLVQMDTRGKHQTMPIFFSVDKSVRILASY